MSVLMLLSSLTRVLCPPDSEGKDKCSMAERRGHNNIIKFMSSTKTQYAFIFKASPDLSVKKAKSRPVFPSIPAMSGQIRPQTGKGRRYLSVTFPFTKTQVREVSGPFPLLSFLFFNAGMCGSRSRAEVNRLVWSCGNSAGMTSSERSQEWKGNLLPGRKWRDLKEKHWLGLFRWSKQRGGRAFTVWNIITQCAGDHARQRATAWFMLSHHLPGKAMEIQQQVVLGDVSNSIYFGFREGYGFCGQRWFSFKLSTCYALNSTVVHFVMQLQKQRENLIELDSSASEIHIKLISHKCNAVCKDFTSQIKN